MNFMGTIAQKLNLIEYTITLYNLVLKLDEINLPVLYNLRLLT